MTPAKPQQSGAPIAIIGMGCIFPESRDLKEYWHLLFNGIDAIRPIPEDSHWKLADYFNPDPAFPDHTYCKRGGFIPEIAFDPLSFGIPPNNIQATDTSQLLGLEVARMALEDAGYPPGHDMLQKKKVNVILGVTGTQELVIPLGARLGHPFWKQALDEAGVAPDVRQAVLERIESSYVQWQENSFPGLLGNVVAGRIANRLDLSGTNAVSDAACASSLSAVHTAVMELQTGRCDISVTGGVDTLNDIFMHMCFSKTGVLSHTSDAKPFSKDADGTVLGEGIGMLVLKRLEDAKKDQDRIYAVIRGMGTSSDGRTSAVYAPEAKGQIRALNDAYARAGIDPSTVELIEAHGTGTRVGDKVEFSALKQCFDPSGRPQSTAVGSVKSMIGHAKAAAGAAGLIKTALALYNKVLPPTLKAGEPDPDLHICDSSFYLNAQAKPWVSVNGKGSPRRSGVSAFGFGGSNFHAVLEEYTPEKSHVSWDGSVQIFAFSGETPQVLLEKIKTTDKAISEYSLENPSAFSRAVAWQASLSRQSFSADHENRLLAVFTRGEDIHDLLETATKTAAGDGAPKSPIFTGTGAASGSLGFVFPGQGSQYPGMARELMAIFPEGTEALTLAQSMVSDVNGDSSSDAELLTTAVYPLPEYARDKKTAEETLRQTQTAQPAIGAVSMALNDILKRFGVTPDLTCGHSFGELSALYAAGWIGKEDFLNLSAARGHYMAQAGRQSGDTGSMLAVQAPMAAIEALIAEEKLDLVLANKNSPAQGVLSGSTLEIDRAKTCCRKRKMRAVKLPVAAAFHSTLVAEAAAPFQKLVAQKSISPSKIAVLSNTTGSPYPETQEEVKSLLGSQLVHPVNFTDNIQAMHAKGVTTFIEVGPKTVLSGLVKAILKDRPIAVQAMDEAGGKGSGLFTLAQVLCRIAAQGHAVDLTAWEEPAARPVLPKMAVVLNGANLKPVSRKKPAASISRGTKSPQARPATAAKPDTPQLQGSDMTPNPDFILSSEIKTEPASQTSGMVQGPNVHLVQKGLEAMQQLQAQTARAHEKFLETQAQASRTLAEIMAQTRGALPVQPTALRPEPPADTQTTAFRPAMPHQQVQAAPRSPEPSYTAPAPQPVQVPAPATEEIPARRAETAPAAPSQPANPPAGDSAQTTLFDIVSRLTGFPVEMLESQMDIESDLGIDSIKKVEIISELEKELPQGAGLSSDHLTSVRTLEDICTAIGGKKGQAAGTAAAVSPEPDKGTPESGGSGRTMAVLVKVISELTGFPREMLEPEMNLESDLGIDSIKRVEILSRLEQELPDLTAISPDDIGALQTLEDIVSFLTSDNKPAANNGPGKKKTPSAAQADPLTESGVSDSDASSLLRQEVVLKLYPTNQIRFYNGARIEVSSEDTVYLTQDSAGIARALSEEFEKLGLKTAFLDLSRDNLPELTDAAGLVIIPDAFGAGDDNTAKTFLSRAFDLARQNGGSLMDTAEKSAAFFTTLSFSGGTFGFEAHAPAMSPVYGGLAGLAKTADIEWKKVLCHALDLPADPERCRENAEAAVALMMTHGAVEMGLDGEHCAIPELQANRVSPGELLMTTEDVVVITGGAKGVTAECALALARACSPKIALLGRSPRVFDEPEWLTSLEEAGDIKQGILKNEFTNGKPKPAEIQRRFQAITSNRAVKENLDRIRPFSPEVCYYSVDIRDRDAVRKTLKAVHEDMGPVTAIIHGAGVLEDKLIVEKHPDQFERVFATKVDGLENLMDAAVRDSLRHVVLFSSVAARFGNQGQCDYAMANEVLNKVAQAEARSNPGCRYLSINWGPWDGGMVNDSLKREFAKRGIDLIPLALGAEQMVLEMAGQNRELVEVVIGAGLKADPPDKAPVLIKAMEVQLGPKASPVINHHRIDRQAVVPLALMAELMAHAGEKNNPGLVFSGIDRMHLLKGIIVKTEDVSVQAELGRCVPENGSYTVPARLVSAAEAGSLPHAGSTILLRDKLPAPPVLSKTAFMDLKPGRMSAEEAYDTVLFHGPALQCITAVNGVSSKGIDVTARCDQGPEQWYAAPHSKRWTLDPLMLDAAFQAAILWTYETRKAVCLPNAWASLRIYSSYPGRSGDVRILFTVNHDGRHSIQGYFTFLDGSGTVIASIMGFEALTDKGLLEKFNASPLFDRDRILAFAQGSPSKAFGKPYEVFDKDREIARLPRPPYFFMDRVVQADHPQWEMTSGGWIEAEYEIPQNEWYFKANRSQAMPFCILLEIALQPCGWLAAYAGSALHSDSRLHFRNLGGKAVLARNLSSESGVVTVRSRMTEVSKAGGMIIQDFDMEVLNNGEMVYQGTTNFGFFTGEALSNQVGIRNSRFYMEVPETGTGQSVSFDQDAPVTPDDPSTGKNSGMPSTALRMIDCIDYINFESGIFGKGMVAGSKTVNPEEWFFDAHFYQDPVCPGSLGVESFLQLLRYFLITKYDINSNDYIIKMGEHSSHEWVYRGQIIPTNKQIEVQAHISSCENREGTYRIEASGSLMVDQICIYEMKDFSLELVPATSTNEAKKKGRTKAAR